MTRASPAGSWRIMSGVMTSWRLAWSWPRIFQDACAAQVAGHLERGGVGDAGQPHLHPAGVQDDLAAVVAPAAAQLRLAVHDGDDLDALAAGVGQPGRQRDRADLGDLVQRHEQRRVQPAGRRGLAGLRGDVMDLAGQAANSGASGASSCSAVSDHVQRPGLAQERGDVEPGRRAGQDRAASSGSVMNASARDRTILIVAAVFCASPRSSASSAPTGPPRRRPGSARAVRVGAGGPGGTRRMSPPARAAAWKWPRR